MGCCSEPPLAVSEGRGKWGEKIVSCGVGRLTISPILLSFLLKTNSLPYSHTLCKSKMCSETSEARTFWLPARKKARTIADTCPSRRALPGYCFSMTRQPAVFSAFNSASLFAALRSSLTKAYSPTGVPSLRGLSLTPWKMTKSSARKSNGNDIFVSL